MVSSIKSMAYASGYSPAWRRQDIPTNVLQSGERDFSTILASAGIPMLGKAPAMGMIPASLRNDGGKTPITRKVENQFHVVRLDTLEFVGSHTVSGKHQLFQGTDALQIFKEIAPTFDLNLRTLGSFDNGAAFWICADLPSYTIADMPQYRNFMHLTHNDGSGGSSSAAAKTDPICENTLQAAVNEMRKNAGNVKLRHIATDAESWQGKIESMMEAIKLSLGWFDWIKKIEESLIKIEATTDHVNSLWDNVLFPMPVIKADKQPIFVGSPIEFDVPSILPAEKESIQLKRRNESRDSYNAIVSEEFGKRGPNMDSLLNVVTGYSQYALRMSESGGEEKEKRMAERRIESNLFGGTAAKLKTQGLNAIMAMAGVEIK